MNKTTTLSVSVIQMCTGMCLDDNLKQAKRLVLQASEQGTQMVILPEYFPFMGRDLSAKLAVQETQGEGPIQEALAAWARQGNVWIVAGSIPIASKDPQRPFARTQVYNSEGNVVSCYDKIHMFDVTVADDIGEYRESEYSLAGTQPAVCDTPWGKLGLAICYDVRFPELFRYYAEQDVAFVALPSAFTVPTGKAHWETLIRARAIENQCFVLAAAQSGEHENGRKTWGHSMIVNPWGEIVAELASDVGVVTVSIDMNQRIQLAKKMPVIAHRQLK